MRVKALVLTIVMAAMTAFAQPVHPEWAIGLCGEALKDAVKAHCSPGATLDAAKRWKAMLEIESVSGGELLNRFGKENFKTATDGVTLMPIADKSWWMADYARLSMLVADMHVTFLCDDTSLAARKDYMPGVITGKTFHDGVVWKTGEDADGQGVWTMPEGYKGELSRALLYAACIYPADLWVGYGAVFMEEGAYPSLSHAAVKFLMAAHEDESPTDREIARDDAIAELQGNRNPFVKWPELAAHIWGDKKEIPYGVKEIDDTESEENEGKDQPGVVEQPMSQLRGIYSRADGTIDLVSAHVPDDAAWTIDGEAVNGRRIEIANLASGKHELKFTAASLRGRMVILVVD